MSRLLVRILVGQVVTVVVLALAAVRWPDTAAQARLGLQTFAVLVAVLAFGFAVAVGVLIVRAQREPPYGQ